MKNIYIVKWTKFFVTGSLKNLSYDSSLNFSSLDSATSYIAFLHEHNIKPVEAIGDSNYTCHMARIEVSNDQN